MEKVHIHALAQYTWKHVRFYIKETFKIGLVFVYASDTFSMSLLTCNKRLQMKAMKPRTFVN